MLTIQDKQFRLNDQGEILFQVDLTKPTPGAPVAVIGKGAALLAPVVALNDGDPPPALGDRAAAQARIEQWLGTHIATVLEPLVALGKADEGKTEAERTAPVPTISARLYEALGIAPRADLEESIEKLDQETRRDLRQRRIRLGPILISMPDLNKPAAVRLRALLWTLWEGKALPATVPPDGMVSITVDENADKAYFRGIGYPVYGPRAIRVDMLDRVVSAVYDNADKGVFKAKHEMAEWLGCSIPELYAVLEAMGHKKIHDPAEEQQEAAETADAPVETTESAPAAPAATEAAAEPAAEEKPAEEGAAPAATEESQTPATPAPQAKPELATFRLRRGRAHEAPKPRGDKPKFAGQKKPFQGGGKPGNKDDRKDQRGKPRKKPHDRRPAEREPRVMVAEAQKNEADSPFAVLQQLKAGRKE